RPCEKHRVELRDERGVLHPLKPDAECRNTMYHGVPQSCLSILPELISGGVKHFRLEALYENPGEIKEKIALYQMALQGKPQEELEIRFQSIEKYGISDGQLLKINTYKNRKKTANFTLNP